MQSSIDSVVVQGLGISSQKYCSSFEDKFSTLNLNCQICLWPWRPFFSCSELGNQVFKMRLTLSTTHVQLRCVFAVQKSDHVSITPSSGFWSKWLLLGVFGFRNLHKWLLFLFGRRNIIQIPMCSTTKTLRMPLNSFSWNLEIDSEVLICDWIQTTFWLQIEHRQITYESCLVFFSTGTLSSHWPRI